MTGSYAIDEPTRWAKLLPRLEADLAQREQTGHWLDEGAWGEAKSLLQAHGRILQISHSLHIEDIQDIVQEVLFKLQSSKVMGSLKASRSPAGYIAVMMKNAATDIVRRQRREVTRESEGQEQESRREETKGDWESLQENLGNALAQLTAEERGLLRMRFWDELSVQEIATQLEIKYSAAAVRLFRILRRLEQFLKNR